MSLNKICVLFALMLAVATIADARPDLSPFGRHPSTIVKKNKENDACCDACDCEEDGSCRCNDIAINRCPSTSCKLCVCTFSYPAACRCLDDIQTCPPKCSERCDECECEKEGSCTCTHRAVGGCPSSCESDVCTCNRKNPPTCWCSTVVDTCPSKCNAINTQLPFIHRPQSSQYYNKLV